MALASTTPVTCPLPSTLLLPPAPHALIVLLLILFLLLLQILLLFLLLLQFLLLLLIPSLPICSYSWSDLAAGAPTLLRHGVQQGGDDVGVVGGGVAGTLGGTSKGIRSQVTDVKQEVDPDKVDVVET